MRRNKDGTFAKGNKGGPGRPRRSTEERYLEALVGQVSVADWQAIVDRAVREARDGDRYARDFLAQYLIGKPTQYIQADVESEAAIAVVVDI